MVGPAGMRTMRRGLGRHYGSNERGKEPLLAEPSHRSGEPRSERAQKCFREICHPIMETDTRRVSGRGLHGGPFTALLHLSFFPSRGLDGNAVGMWISKGQNV